MAGALYDRFAAGELQNLDHNRVRWIPPGPTWTGPDLFEFIPNADRPFTFIRHSGQQVSPHNMITDIGSIPRLAGLFSRGLTPWGYAAPYLVHDWEFELHHCGGTTKTFDQVRDTMMECVKKEPRAQEPMELLASVSGHQFGARASLLGSRSAELHAAAL
jgi:hypothetical protein